MASEADRKRRLLLLGGAILAAALVVVVLVVVSLGGSDDEDGGSDGGETAGLFDGIPQRGISLGDPDAPVRVVEFADLQCPFCAEYSRQVLPSIVEDYVRPGDVRLELQVLTFLGDDSVTAGLAATAAAEQNRMWQFADVFYREQGEENSGYVTPAFLRRIAREADARPAPIVAAAESGGTDRLLTEADREGQRLDVPGTPAFFVARGDAPLEPLPVSELTPEAFREALDQVVGE